jgi:hypothetical protein
VEAIGGNTPKFLGVATPDAEASDPASVRIEVSNPHLVVIGELAVEVRDQKVHITPSGDEVEFVFHGGGAAPAGSG